MKAAQTKRNPAVKTAVVSMEIYARGAQAGAARVENHAASHARGGKRKSVAFRQYGMHVSSVQAV